MAGPDVRLELQLKGSAQWVDITGYRLERTPIAVTRGVPDEGVRGDPAKLICTLDNRDGRFSPRNPSSPWYGQLGRNTPIRLSLRTGPMHLMAHGPSGTLTTPDTGALDITGDLDIRVDFAAEGVKGYLNVDGTLGRSCGLASKMVVGAGTGQSWSMYLLTTAQLAFEWSTDGTDAGLTTVRSTVPALWLQSGRRCAVRATLDVNNGAGGHTVMLYTAPTIAGPWTQLGTTYTAPGTTSVWASTSAVVLGVTQRPDRDTVLSRIYAAQIRSGIGDAAPLVADVDVTARAAGDTSWTDSAGRIWTVEGDAQVWDRRIRFLGEVASWPVDWDLSGRDVTASIQAAGILRRYGQGARPVQSTLRRRIPSATSLVAYWPFEDGQGVTQAAAVVGPYAADTAGFTFGAASGLAGSLALPTVGEGGYLLARVPAYPATGQWRAELVYKLDSMPSTLCALMDIRTSTATHRIMISPTDIRLRGYNSAWSQIYESLLGPVADFTGQWTQLFVWARQNGPTVNLELWWTPIGRNGNRQLASFTGAVGQVTGVSSNFGGEFGVTSLSGFAMGHVAVFGAADEDPYAVADAGYPGDTVSDRMMRVSAEYDLPLVMAGGYLDMDVLGPQPVSTLLGVLDDAAGTDGGVLVDRRERAGVRYRSRTTLYNQTPTLVLDYAAAEVHPEFRPVDDDQSTRNDITVQRRGGGSARAVQTVGPLAAVDPVDGGVGLYDASHTLSLDTDDQCLPHASWRLHLGTVDEARYPSVTVNLAANPHLAADVIETDVLDRIQVMNPPPWLPPDDIDLIVRSYEERIGLTSWEWTATCGPGSPWTVGAWADPVLSRVDTAGSVLAQAIAAPAPLADLSAYRPVAHITPTGSELRRGSESGPRLQLAGVTGFVIQDSIVGPQPLGDQQHAARASIAYTLKSWGANYMRIRLWAAEWNILPPAEQDAYLQKIVDWRDTLRAVGLITCLCWWDALDGPFAHAAWATNYQRAFPMMTAVMDALGDDPTSIAEPWNEPNGISDGQWYTAMRDTITHFRTVIGYTGILILDPNIWAHAYDHTLFTNLENHDASLIGRPNLLFAKHDYPNDYPSNTFDATTYVNATGGADTSHLRLETETGIYNGPTVNVPAFGAAITTYLAARMQTQINLAGAAMFVWGNWYDPNALTTGDYQTPTTWGGYAKNNFFANATATVIPPSGASEIVVATALDPDATRPGWVASSGPNARPAQHPFDLRVGAETVEVLAVDQYARDAFARTVTGGWGAADVGGTWDLSSGGVAAERTVTAGAARLALTSDPGAVRQQTLPGALAGDVEITTQITLHQVSTGTAVMPAVLARWMTFNDYYRVRVQAEVGGALVLAVLRATTQIGATVATGLTYTTGTQLALRVRIIGHRVLARLWPVAAAEPTTWGIDRTVDVATGQIASGRVGLALSAFAGNTNTNPAASFDEFHLENVQRLTVIRGRNGVSRGWDAGTDVRLANPMRVAL
ncbi:hypothetical protein MXD61_11305 [Frankia sp. AgPm24]|uniref:hypothetical protein n=1 Tax=Frankia sp. AgPm24 TaxID=631128 RepID=UPI00200E82E1|nr:hypothetical protein [Frankia sp. AgPm24]MCK9922459.1 hypothetical protein [Frankia sp. AgPm24]